jgi:KaiC/GvpD/RAD55 family RecA-like ATPase
MAKASTQDFLEIDQIREGVVILKNRALRGVMLVSSLNFALKSQEEQSAIIYQFQNFLNSLDFSCQIVVQSRRINITNYLETLKYLEKKQKNELLKIQTASYRNFIEELVAGGTIMTKHFFLVVPYTHLEAGEIAKAGKSLLTNRTLFTLTEKVFQRAKTQLWQRMEFVALGLRRCGLRAMPLSTPELIELFWQLHHPQEAEVGYYPEIPPELIR